MKRVLHLRSSAGVFGAESVIIELAKHSSNFGYDSMIGALKVDSDPYPEFIDVAKGENIKTTIFEGKGRIDFKCIKNLKKFIRENRIDVLHCHGYKEDLYGIFAPSGVAKVATNHLWKKLFLRGKLNALMDSFFLRFYDKIVGVSDEILNDMKAFCIMNTVKISNGVDTDKFKVNKKSDTLLTKFELPPESKILGMISSLTYEKGHHIAINAFRKIVNKHPDTRLLIVGDGRLMNELRNHVKELSMLDFVIFAGKQKNIPEILSIIDIFLLPSLVEGLPIALLEAMSSGKAVVATKVGENENVISNNKTGILIEPSSEEELTEAILYLLSGRISIKELGKSARDVVVQNYSSVYMTEQYCELYNSIIDFLK